jgi:dCTP deaminase
VANPKSSTGRLDVLTRLITDQRTAFDRIEKGYRGKLYLEIAPLSFPIVVKPGVRLNQVRFQAERGTVGGIFPQVQVTKLYETSQLVRGPGPRLRGGEFNYGGGGGGGSFASVAIVT